ncbi:MAG: DUF192 domain-containing protein [Steroidobacteraceae bacterium]
MLKFARQTLTVLWLLVCIASARADEPTIDQLLADFPRAELTISTPDARQHRFQVWIATTDVHRAQGLMFVRALPPDAGMLFVYSEPRTISMWMKNTFIPLDMVFIKANGRVAQVVGNTTPHSLKSIVSKSDVVAVLELNADTADRLGIRSGALVDRRLLQAAASGP